MIGKRSLLLGLLATICSVQLALAGVTFHNGSLLTAKEKAAAEGKLYFVEFEASWCMPCRWMEETTFADPTLGAYVDQNYIAVKVDIDDFDGYAWKQQYNIKLLPTILVFNSQGKLVDRYEESLPPSKMLNILKKHDTQANRVKTNPKPQDEVVRPPLPVEDTPVQPTPPITKPPKVEVKPVTVPGNVNSPTIASGDGLFRFTVMRQSSSGFAVQIGAFQEYGNVLIEVEKLQSKFDVPILVHIGSIGGKVAYKVLVGAFNTRNEVEAYREQMSRQNVEGFIKDLSLLK